MSKAKGCIFVVDDQKGIVESIEAQFYYLGYEVIKATDAKRALELSDQIKPDLIITDIRMPKLDGIAFVKKFKQVQPQVKVIFLTGYYPEYEKEIKEAQDLKLVDGVIQKPFYSRDLENLARKVLHPVEERQGKQIHAAKILIVDDEVEVADFLKEYFREHGYAVAGAANFDEALLIFENFHPDLIITDIKLPGKDGVDLIKEIRRRDKDMQFIVMTGQSHHLVLERLEQETHIADFISKPIGLPAIEKLVKKVVDMISEKKSAATKSAAGRKK